MKNLAIAIIALISLCVTIGGVYAFNDNHRAHEITDYAPGHTHDDSGITHGAIQHSGGTNKQGCHNASVPYHCH